MRSLFIGVAAVTLAAAIARAEAAVTTVRDFETNSFKGLVISGNSPQIQSSVVRAGRYGMRSHLDRYGSKTSYRTEVRVLAPDPIHKQEYWYGFGVYLPAGYATDNVWEMVAQWHNNPDAGDAPMSPVIALTTTDGVWKVVNRWTSQRIVKSKSAVSIRSFGMGRYETGRWTDFVFRIKWSYESDGILEVWKNGVKIVSAKGPNCFNDARMPYFKMGIYKGWRSGDPAGRVTKRTLYHDQFRMVGPGGSYGQVAPSSAAAVSAPTELAVE